jgi:hypothetical protein
MPASAIRCFEFTSANLERTRLDSEYTLWEDRAMLQEFTSYRVGAFVARSDPAAPPALAERSRECAKAALVEMVKAQGPPG